jgi:hypothetical protein
VGLVACGTSGAATDARLVFTVDMPLTCASLERLAVGVAHPGDPEGTPAVVVTACADPVPGTIGSLVVTQGGAARIQVVARATFVDGSGGGSFDVVARRVLDFQAGKEVRVPIAFSLACVGVDCSSQSTCVAPVGGKTSASCIPALVQCTGPGLLCNSSGTDDAGGLDTDGDVGDDAGGDGADASDATDGPLVPDTNLTDGGCIPFTFRSSAGTIRCGGSTVSANNGSCCDSTTGTLATCSSDHGNTFDCDQDIDCPASTRCCISDTAQGFFLRCSPTCASAAHPCQMGAECVGSGRCCGQALAPDFGVCYQP